MSTEQHNTEEVTAATHKVLAVPGRIALLNALDTSGERVTRLATTAGRRFNQASNDLRLFLDAGLVEYERDGSFHYYRLTAYGKRVRDVMRSRETE